MSAELMGSQQLIHDAVLRIRNGVGFGELLQMGIIEITGPDAASFLQNRTTNDVNALREGDGQLSALLDRKAHIQAFYTLHRLGNSFWMTLKSDGIPNALAEIEKYHITEQFTATERSDEWRTFIVQGPESPAFILQGMPPGEAIQRTEPLSLSRQKLFETDCLLMPRSMTGEKGYFIFVPIAEADAFRSQVLSATSDLNPVALTPDILETLRIEAGLARMGLDMDTETLLPETGLEQCAVSYTKGCYLGQETVARVKTYGSVQKALVGLILSTQQLVPANGANCVQHGQVIGSFRSGVVSPTLGAPIVMAYLNREFRVPGKVLKLEYDGGTIDATVTMLPFYRNEKGGERAKELLESGLSAFAQDREDEAIDKLRQALALDPNQADAYEALGVILSRREQYEEAISLMLKLSEIDPDRVMAHTNLSVYYMKIGDKEMAEEEKAKALVLQMRKAAKDAQHKQNEEEERKKREAITLERIKLFQQALQMAPTDPLANFGLGSSYLELQRYAEAIDPFKMAIQGQPNHSVAYLSLGKCLEQTGQSEEAKATYGQGIEVAAKRGDRMPLQEMQQRLDALPTG